MHQREQQNYITPKKSASGNTAFLSEANHVRNVEPDLEVGGRERVVMAERQWLRKSGSSSFLESIKKML